MGRAYAVYVRLIKTTNGLEIMKKLILPLIMAALYYGVANSQAPIPVEGWPYVTRCIDFGVWIPRLSLDEGQMHLFFVANTGEVDKFELNGTFSPGWPLIIDSVDWMQPPVTVDFDHDGLEEILCLGWDHTFGQNRYRIYLFDDNGTVMPGFPISVGFNFFCVADFDGDNEYEITGYDYDNRMLFSIDRFGNPKPGWPISFDLPRHPNVITGGPAVGDLDLDGTNEFLLSTERYIYAFRYDGTIQDGFPIQLHADTVYYYDNGGLGISLADVNHDGFLEIITYATNFNPPNFNTILFIYEHDGAIKEGWPKYIEGKYFSSSITPADINGDGQVELIYQADSLTVVDMDLNPLPGWPTSSVSPEGTHGTIFSDVDVLDIDGDGDMEVLFGHNVFYPDSMGQDSTWYYGHGYQFGVDHLGQPLPGFPLKIKGTSSGLPPTLGLEPSSSRLYLSVGSMFFLPTIEADTLFVELYLFPDSTGVPNQWPMYSHDNLMTRNYNFVDRVTAITDDAPLPLPKSAILKQNYPNPFNSSTIIEYTLPKREQVTVSVYDILGRKIKNIDEGIYPAGNRQISLNMGDYASGVYYVILNTEDTHITRKLVLLK
jgi:hypothetical protein